MRVRASEAHFALGHRVALLVGHCHAHRYLTARTQHTYTHSPVQSSRAESSERQVELRSAWLGSSIESVGTRVPTRLDSTRHHTTGRTEQNRTERESSRAQHSAKRNESNRIESNRRSRVEALDSKWSNNVPNRATSTSASSAPAETQSHRTSNFRLEPINMCTTTTRRTSDA